MEDVVEALNKHAHWLLRLGIGSIFLYHGLTKFPQAAPMAEMMGMSVFMLVLVAAAETAGGALVLLGGFGSQLFTRLGAVLLIPVMLGAIGMVHWGQWSFAPSETHPMGGMQFQVLIILVLGYLALRGSSGASARL